MDDWEYHIKKKPGKTYISKSLPSFGDSDRKVRIASKVFDSDDDYAFAMIKDESVLRHTKGGRKEIKAKFLEDNRGIFVLNIQGYTSATEKPHNASFAFIGDEIGKVVEFFKNIHDIQLSSDSGINITDENLRKLLVTNHQARELLHDNQEVFAEVIKSEITKEDIVAVGYRKRQLDVYSSLLEDDNYFQSLKKRKKCSNEALWQQFFEKNQWVFGYGLGYIFLSNLNDKKLEQVVQGYDVSRHGKRVDALMKTKGIISNLCFIEIKTHKTPLLESQPYRSGCWAPSRELASAVSQVQGTVATAIENLSTKIAFHNEDGTPTGEEAFNYQPKSYLVIGGLGEFVSEHGVNQDKFRSFELYRKNTSNPEIITFDELYERAKYIVHQNQS